MFKSKGQSSKFALCFLGLAAVLSFNAHLLSANDEHDSPMDSLPEGWHVVSEPGTSSETAAIESTDAGSNPNTIGESRLPGSSSVVIPGNFAQSLSVSRTFLMHKIMCRGSGCPTQGIPSTLFASFNTRVDFLEENPASRRDRCALLQRNLSTRHAAVDQRQFDQITTQIVAEQSRAMRAAVASAQLQTAHSQFQEAAARIGARGPEGAPSTSLRDPYAAIDEALQAIATTAMDQAYQGYPNFLQARGAESFERFWSITHDNELILTSCTGVPVSAAARAPTEADLRIYCTTANVTRNSFSGETPGPASDQARGVERYASYFGGVTGGAVQASGLQEWSLQQVQSPDFQLPRGMTRQEAENCIRARDAARPSSAGTPRGGRTEIIQVLETQQLGESIQRVNSQIERMNHVTPEQVNRLMREMTEAPASNTMEALPGSED